MKSLEKFTLRMAVFMVLGYSTVSGTVAEQQTSSNRDPLAGQMQVLDPAVAAATVTHSGTFDITLNITIKSTIPTTQALQCLTLVTASDSSVAHNYYETSGIAATRTGDTATCTMTVPYSWKMGTGGGYTAGYTVSAISSNGNIIRQTESVPTAATAFPANGATTNLTYPIVM
jgi:hypothetical protein